MNVQNLDTGETPLHSAVLNSNNELIKLLLFYGAKTDIKNKKNLTPIEIARAQKNSRAIAIFEPSLTNLVVAYIKDNKSKFDANIFKPDSTILSQELKELL